MLTGLRFSQVRLIASYWVRFSLRTGGGLMARDADLGEKSLIDGLAALLQDAEEMQAMGRRAAEMGRPDAARDISQELMTLVRQP